jgi:hypothetical protein
LSQPIDKFGIKSVKENMIKPLDFSFLNRRQIPSTPEITLILPPKTDDVLQFFFDSKTPAPSFGAPVIIRYNNSHCTAYPFPLIIFSAVYTSFLFFVKSLVSIWTGIIDG